MTTLLFVVLVVVYLPSFVFRILFPVRMRFRLPISGKKLLIAGFFVSLFMSAIAAAASCVPATNSLFRPPRENAFYFAFPRT